MRNGRLPLLAAILAHDLRCFAEGSPTSVGPIARHGVEAVCYGDHTRSEWDIELLEATRVSFPIPTLMMMAHDRHPTRKIWVTCEKIGTMAGVAFHDCPFFWCQQTGLVQHPIGNADL